MRAKEQKSARVSPTPDSTSQRAYSSPRSLSKIDSFNGQEDLLSELPSSKWDISEADETLTRSSSAFFKRTNASNGTLSTVSESRSFCTHSREGTPLNEIASPISILEQLKKKQLPVDANMLPAEMFVQTTLSDVGFDSLITSALNQGDVDSEREQRVVMYDYYLNQRLVALFIDILDDHTRNKPLSTTPRTVFCRSTSGRWPGVEQELLFLINMLSEKFSYVDEEFNLTFVFMLVYLDAYFACTKDYLQLDNIKQLILSSILLASKFNDHDHLRITDVAEIGRIKLKKMNELELTFFKNIDMKLHVSPDVIADYLVGLSNYRQKPNSLLISPDQTPVMIGTADVPTLQSSSMDRSVKFSSKQKPVERVAVDDADRRYLPACSMM